MILIIFFMFPASVKFPLVQQHTTYCTPRSVAWQLRFTYACYLWASNVRTCLAFMGSGSPPQSTVRTFKRRIFSHDDSLSTHSARVMLFL
jgi:hypothetical protein